MSSNLYDLLDHTCHHISKCQKICDATNEYAERQKDKHPVMYRYFSPMTPDDFYALVGIFVHLGYRKIPRYRLLWTPTSLCYDPLISNVFNWNKFEGFLSFLHTVDEDREEVEGWRGQII